MLTVKVFDSAELGKVERMDTGFLRVPARLTRTGVFQYSQPDGTTKNVLRLAADVFKDSTLRSFELSPLTLKHPPGEVNASNFKTYAVGSVAHVGVDSADSSFVSAVLLVADAAAVEAVESGIREVSAGYYADLEPAPAGALHTDALTGASTPYDFIHRNIRGNHVALVDKGRAGPHVRLMMDAAEELHPQPIKDSQMEKLVIDGVEVEAPKLAVELVKKQLSTLTADAARLQGQVDAQKSRADNAEAKLKEATSPTALAKAVCVRMGIEKAGEKYALNLDGLTDHEARCAVIAKIDTKLVIDGRSEEVVAGMFEVVSSVAVVPPKASTVTVDSKSTNDLQKKYTQSFYRNHAEVK